MKSVYLNQNWLNYRKLVLKRDNYTCQKCEGNNILQVHHLHYVKGQKIWEYPLSSCITLCRSCHAEEHHLKSPKRGWTLIEIVDLEDLTGECENNKSENTRCKTPIRYEHYIYHPLEGYIIVGSKCVQRLTKEEQKLSKKVLEEYKKIQRFVFKSIWRSVKTKNGFSCIETEYLHHKLRIYGTSIQLAIKQPGIKRYNWTKVVKTKSNSLLKTKELVFVFLQGMLSKDKDFYRNIYKTIIYEPEESLQRI